MSANLGIETAGASGDVPGRDPPGEVGIDRLVVEHEPIHVEDGDDPARSGDASELPHRRDGIPSEVLQNEARPDEVEGAVGEGEVASVAGQV